MADENEKDTCPDCGSENISLVQATPNPESSVCMRCFDCECLFD